MAALLLSLLAAAGRATAAATAGTEGAATDTGAGSSFGECQPKAGMHRHQPQFHIIAPMFAGGGLNGTSWPGGVNDVNAVFQYKGVWHIMHQCDGGDPGVPCGGGWEGPTKHPDPRTQRFYHSWGHVVSKDLVRWKRLADALAPNTTNFEHGADCDGSVSFPAGVGPVMMYGPGCGYRGPDSRGEEGRLRAGLGDAPVVGVALPENPSDPELEHWVRSPPGPVGFATNSPPCSFAGSVWQHGEHWSLICTADGTRARYTAPSAGGAAGLAGPWSRADAAFGGNSSGGHIGGNSGPAFLPLPPPPPPPSTLLLLQGLREQGGHQQQPTHVMSSGSGSTFSVGTYDQQTEAFHATAQFETDLGQLGWTAGGLAEDGRVLLVGWVAAGNDPPAHAAGCPTVGGIKVCGVQAESAVRVLSWEASTRRLLAYPPVEMAGLRNATLCNLSSLVLPPPPLHRGPKNGSAAAVVPVALPLPKGTGAAVDVEIDVALPPASARAVGFSFGVRVFASRQPHVHDDHIVTRMETSPSPFRILNGTNFRAGNVGFHSLPAGTPDAAGHAACSKLCGARPDCTAWVLVKAGESGAAHKQPGCALKGRSYCVNALSHPCAGCQDEGGKAGQCYCDAGIKPGNTPPPPGKCGGGIKPSPSPPPPPASDEGVAAVIHVSAAAQNGSRVCSVVMAGVHHGTFPLLAGESSIAVRVLVDRSIAEFFFAGGRAVYTARYYPALGADGVELFVPPGGAADEEGSAVVVATAVAYEMGCGWED
eukprot:SAG22_NODE_892_length_6646_cov_21.438369_3_plen_762_part_00